MLKFWLTFERFLVLILTMIVMGTVLTACPGSSNLQPDQNTRQDATSAHPSPPEVVCGQNQVLLDGSCRGHIAEIAVGEDFACVRSHNGAVVCYGDNQYGQLGVGADVRSCAPQLVPLSRPAIQVETSQQEACAVTEDGEVWCWGRTSGTYGAGVVHAEFPHRVEGFDAVVASLSMAWHFGCAVTATGRVACFYGGPASPSCTDAVLTARDMGLSSVIQLAATTGLVCATHDTGRVSCWGQVDWSRELSAAAGSEPWVTPDSDTLPLVWELPLPATDAVEVAVSPSLVCFRRSSGQVLCASFEAPDVRPEFRMVESLSGLEGVQQLLIDPIHPVICARRDPQAMRCVSWLEPSGQLLDSGDIVVVARDPSATNGYARNLACAATNSGQLTCIESSSFSGLFGETGSAGVVELGFDAGALARIEAACAVEDADADGIPDDIDVCPNSLEDFRGPWADDGCADGNQGAWGHAPLIAVNFETLRIELLEPIEFEFDDERIRPVSYPVLEQLASVIQHHVEIGNVTVDGHISFAQFTARELSGLRAQSVTQFLVEHGVDRDRLRYQGFGDTQPLMDPATPEGRAANRRIEVRFERRRLDQGLR